MWFTVAIDSFFEPRLDKKKKGTNYKLHTLFFFSFFFFSFCLCKRYTWNTVRCIISIWLNHYHKPPKYSEEITFGSGFPCLNTYSASPTLPGCVDLYGLYMHPGSFTCFLYISVHRLNKIYVQVHSVVAVGMVPSLKSCAHLCVCTAELYNKPWFDACILPHRGCFSSDAMSSVTAASVPCCAQSYPMPAKLAAVRVS